MFSKANNQQKTLFLITLFPKQRDVTMFDTLTYYIIPRK